MRKWNDYARSRGYNFMNTPTVKRKIDIEFEVSSCDSSAIQKIAYSSRNETLTVVFNNTNDKEGREYNFDNVLVSDALSLIARAVNLDSWGKAWHDWKRDHPDLVSRETHSREAIRRISSLSKLIESLNLTEEEFYEIAERVFSPSKSK